MLIGIDASRALRAKRTGTERYSLELINALLALESGHDFELYVPTRPANLDLFHPLARFVIVPGKRLWTHTRLGPHVRRHPPDVFFVPAHVLPVAGPLAHPLPSVVTVHDLGYEHFPNAHPWRERAYLRWSTQRHARVATRIIADSQATKDDLVRLYGADPARVHVVYLAPDAALAPERDPARVARARQSYGLPEDAEYILHIGTLQPRKNLARLIEAFARVRQQLPERSLYLVLAGSPGHDSQLLYEKPRSLGIEEFVRFTGFARVHDIPGLYSGARCYVFPSLCEGFGFPVLEAQTCETPLLCANASSLPEVAGEGALYFDPLDIEAIAAALIRILTEPDLRTDLVTRGKANLARFSWARTAADTLAVLESAAS